MINVLGNMLSTQDILGLAVLSTIIALFLGSIAKGTNGKHDPTPVDMHGKWVEDEKRRK